MDDSENYSLLVGSLFMSIIFFVIALVNLIHEITTLNELNQHGKTMLGYANKDDMGKKKVVFYIDSIEYSARAKFTINLRDSYLVRYSERKPNVARIFTYWEYKFPGIFYTVLFIISILTFALSIVKRDWLMKQEGGLWSGS